MRRVGSALRIGIDGTPLLRNRTGIGQYTAHLTSRLAGRPDVSLTCVPFTARGGRRPVDLVPSVRWRHLPVPARALHHLWARSPFPPVELLAGRVDVFHGTNFVLPPTARARGVLTVHDLSFVRYPEFVDSASLAYRTLVPRGVRRAAVVVTPSEAVAAELVDRYRLDPAKVVVTPLGVDPQWSTPDPQRDSVRASMGLPGQYLLGVGTFEPRKGLDVLIAAYRQLVAEGADVPPLVLVGPAGWGPELDVSGIPDGRLIRPGFVPSDRLRSVVAGASAFVFPSRYEGFGLPPLEAMSAGVPVVASDIATSREVLGGFASLAPAGDVGALAAAILATLSDADPVRLSAARRHAAKWTWERCADATVSAYRLAVS